ncbi:MAG TPA: hypothetical protein VIM60_10565 [Edaphobacter sp.]
MFLDRILAIGLYAFVCVFSIVFACQRMRWRRTRRGFRPSGAMLGNALQQLQTIAEPLAQHVIEEKEDEDADDEEAGGPDDPVRHLHRQARKIRRGERLENLTVYLRRR